MPVHRNPFQKGNMYVRFEVEFPDPQHLTPEKRALLEQALPPRTPLEHSIEGEHEDVVLAEVDPMHQERGQGGGRRGNAHDSDEEMDEDGHPGVQCAQS